MIRNGEHTDVPAIVDMAREFWSHTVYEDPYDPESVARMATLCIDQGLMSIAQIGGCIVGFACGIMGGLLGNGSVRTGTEVAWWLNPEHRNGKVGILLLKHLEDRARDAGIKYWNMAYMMSSMPEQVESIYQRLGYTKTEVIYSRVL